MKKNTHYWALMNGELLVVLFDGENTWVAGGWEGAVEVDCVLAEIPRPEGLEDARLYYGIGDRHG